MTSGHRFDGVADEFAAGQRKFHSLMPHGDAVADSDGRKFQRRSSGEEHAAFCRLSHAVQKEMSRNQLILCVDDADERAVDLFSDISHSVKKGTYRRSAGSLLDFVTVHLFSSFFCNSAVIYI